MASKHTSLLFILVGLAAGFTLSSVLSRDSRITNEIIIEKRDTITMTDTLFIEFPIVVDIEISENEIEIPIPDIIIKSDSLVVLPIEVKTYEGDGYKAQISGYRPNLEWIELYPETNYVTKETIVRKPSGRWSVGLQTGYGLTLNSGRIAHGPYIGIGISYNLLCF
ncbi:MAG: hypothetical protein NC308_01195 [Clostridium sp.]|nr:hypothetical protein [Bacteroides sp.]MCM1197481.1 hypothetical protein [Clostridium sp.]